jgi:hypothetical protein
MIRTAFAIAVATLAFMSVSQAAPIAPLAGADAAQATQATHVRCWNCRRHCWVGPHGHAHCG